MLSISEIISAFRDLDSAQGIGLRILFCKKKVSSLKFLKAFCRDHTAWCSGMTSVFVLRNHSCRARGILWGAKDQAWVRYVQEHLPTVLLEPFVNFLSG